MDELTTAKQRHNAASTKKARIEGELNAKKASMKQLLEEITEAGYDAKTLSSTLSKKRTTLNAKLTAFTTELEAAEAQLAKFPG